MIGWSYRLWLIRVTNPNRYIYTGRHSPIYAGKSPPIMLCCTVYMHKTSVAVSQRVRRVPFCTSVLAPAPGNQRSYLPRKNVLRLKRGGFETRSRQKRVVVAVTTASGFIAEIVRNRQLSSVILGVSHSYVKQAKNKSMCNLFALYFFEYKNRSEYSSTYLFNVIRCRDAKPIGTDTYKRRVKNYYYIRRLFARQTHRF